MTRRTRTLAGIVTLMALTMSLGETVYASLCMPMSDMGGGGGQMEMADGASDRVAPPMSICMLVSSGDGGGPDEGPQDMPCPLNPAVGSGCTAVASLPGHQVIAVAATPHAMRHLASTDAGSDLLLAHGLFRPPRA